MKKEILKKEKKLLKTESNINTNHRTTLLYRFNVKLMPNENYKLTLHRAYYTYFTNNELFEK